jgi:hypothetical protein
MRVHTPVLAGSAAAAFLAFAHPAAAQDEFDALWTKLQPYRAVFALRLREQPSGAAENVALSGRMEMESRLGCHDFAVAITMTLRMTAGAQSVTAVLEQKSHETRNGRIYRFSTRTLENGHETERREGQAVLETRDGPGEGTIKVGAPETVRIEPGTVLPGTHNLRMLAAAAAGKREVKHRVFFGQDQMRLTDVTATITSRGTAPKHAGLGEFAGKPGWTIREDYREVGSGPDVQPHVTETFYTEEGVPADVLVTVQGLAIAGRALSVEKLPKPECKG